MILTQPTYDEVLAASTKLAERVQQLEEALLRVSDLSICGTWPSWEMGVISRKALGPSFERRHQQMVADLAVHGDR